MFKNLEKTLFIGKKLLHLPLCHSTNDYGLELIKSGLAENGQVIITSNQIKGRGQRGNRWISEPDKNLTFTILMDISFVPSIEIFKVTMAISLGISDSLLKLFKETLNFEDGLRLKWPNDIYFNNRKMGGILIENIMLASKDKWCAIGIGLNCNQLEFNYLNATSLALIFNDQISLENLLLNICEGIETRIGSLENKSFKVLKAEYLDNLYQYNRWCNFKVEDQVFEGKIVDIDLNGRLGVQRENGIVFFDLKEIRFL